MKHKTIPIKHIASLAAKAKKEWFWIPVAYGSKNKPIPSSVECWFNTEYYSYEDSIVMTRPFDAIPPAYRSQV